MRLPLPLPRSSSALISVHPPTPPFRLVNSVAGPAGILDLKNTVDIPLALLGSRENLAALVRQLGLTLVAGDLLEEDGLEDLARPLALAGLLALLFLELNLDRRRLGELLGVDGLGDARPELEGLVLELLLGWGENLGGNIQGAEVDDCVAGLEGMRILRKSASRNGNGTWRGKHTTGLEPKVN